MSVLKSSAPLTLGKKVMVFLHPAAKWAKDARQRREASGAASRRHKGYLPRMRTVLLIITWSTLVLIAAIPDGDIRWYLALLGCLAAGLAHVLGERERKVEHRQVQQTVWNDVTSFVASVERKSEEHRADQE